jgi:O-antigen ligase
MTSRLVQYGYVLLPFAVLSLGQLRNGHTMALLLLTIALIGSRLQNRYARYFVYYFVCWHLFVRINLVFNSKSLDAIVRAQMAGPHLYYFVFGLALFYVLGSVKKEVLYQAVCIGAVVQTVIAILQEFGWFPYFSLLKLAGLPVVTRVQLDPQVFGTLNNPNFLAMYLAMSLPFFIRPIWVIAILPIAVLILTLKTSAVVGALMIALVACLWMNKNVLSEKYQRTVLLLLILFVSLFTYFYLRFYDNTTGYMIFEDERMSIWARVFNTIISDPIYFMFGVGPNGWVSKEWHYLHNDWLRLWLEMGLVGIGLIGAFLYTTIGKNAPSLAVIILAGCMLFHFPTRLAPTIFVGLVALVLCEKERANV